MSGIRLLLVVLRNKKVNIRIKINFTLPHFGNRALNIHYCSDYMWLHIRGVGEWTNRLYSYFEEEQQKLHLLNEEPVPEPANRKTSTTDSIESSKMKKLQT